MLSFMNTLGARPRREQWRVRHIFRASNALGRLDFTDAGLIDFSTCSEVLLTVTPRDPWLRRWCGYWNGSCSEPQPVLSTGTVTVANPASSRRFSQPARCSPFPPGLYDVRVAVTIGPKTEEILCEPVELA